MSFFSLKLQDPLAVRLEGLIWGAIGVQGELMRYHLWRRVKVAVVQTRSLFSFSITSLVQLTRMGSLAGFLDNSKSLLGIAAGLGLARHFRVPVRTRSWFLWSAHRSVTFWKNRPDDGVKMGSLEPFVVEYWPELPEGVCWLVTRPVLGIGSQWASRLPR